MTDEQVIPVNMNICIHEFDEFIMVDIAGPFYTRKINIPCGEDIPAMILGGFMSLRAIVWDYHYKTGKLRAIYENGRTSEVHLVYQPDQMADEHSTEQASIHHIDDPLPDDELQEEYTVVWAAEETDINATPPKH